MQQQAPKPDIQNREDIIRLVNTFYEKVKVDPAIGHFFTRVIQVNWEKHLPVMYDFWENILFYTGSYSGNPMTVHKALNERSPLANEHFERWLSLFCQTADELFEGPKTNLIKERALSIATVMQIKIMGESLPLISADE